GANILTINETFQTTFFSQEFTLSGEFDRGSYVFGAYYSDEDIDATHQLLWGSDAQQFFNVLLGAQGLPPGTADARAGLWSDGEMPAGGTSYAAFMHWNFDITDSLKAIFGLRYSHDEKDGAFVRHYFTP